VKKTLIKGGTVVTGDRAIGDLPKGDVLVEGDRIASVAPSIQAGDAAVIDATDKIVMPGLVQAHYHAWMTGLRSFGGNWSNPDYFKKMHGNIATKFSAEDIYLGTLIGALDQINSGSTTLFEWCHNNPTPAHSDRSIDALQESGIRAVFGHGTPKPDQEEGRATAKPKHYTEIPQDPAEVGRLRKGRLSSDDALVTMALAILGPDFGTEEVMLQDLKTARDFGLMSSAHVWNWPGKPRIAPNGYMGAIKAGLIGPDHNVVHFVYSTDEELKALADAGASFSSTPVCELMGNPVHSIGRILELGAKPSLGADNQTKVAGDMFSVMRYAIQSQRVFDQQAHPERPLDTSPRSSREAFEWATIEGAKMMGMEDKIGSLTPGKQADIVLLNANDIGIFPVHDPVNTIVFYCDRSSVDTVMIAGKIMKQAGKLTYPQAEIAKKQRQMTASLQGLVDRAKYVHEPA
jgi:cytosine/adenosine deaminase-related metal-dependent hydrolase